MTDCCYVVGKGDSTHPVRHELSFASASGLLSAVSTKSSPSGESHVVFTGCDLSEKRLKDLLRECLPQVMAEKNAYCLPQVTPEKNAYCLPQVTPEKNRTEPSSYILTLVEWP